MVAERMKRTDIHRPSQMNPAEYRVLAVGYVDEAENTETGAIERFLVLDRVDARWSELGEPEGSNWAGHREGRCDHCGARIKYYSVVEHRGTGDVLVVGLQCTNRFFNCNFNYRQQVLKARAEGDRRVREWLAKNPELGLVYQFSLSDAAMPFAQDMARKVREYGSLSEKQAAALVKSYAIYVERKAEKVERAKKPTANCPVGRVQVVGTVVGRKTIEGADRWMPPTYKMIVEDDRGFKCYGTIPSAILGVIRGERVSFTAQLEPAHDDPTFGWFKRPTKATVLEDEPMA